MSLLQRRKPVTNAEYHKKHINTFCGDNSAFLAVPASGTYNYRGADKSLARPGRKKATATEDFDIHISYLLSQLEEY
jgi:hypothetical protein